MGLRLFILANFPGATFIPGGTFIPDSRVLIFNICTYVVLIPNGACPSTPFCNFLMCRYNLWRCPSMFLLQTMWGISRHQGIHYGQFCKIFSKKCCSMLFSLQSIQVTFLKDWSNQEFKNVLIFSELSIGNNFWIVF